MRQQHFWLASLVGIGLSTAPCEGYFSMAYSQKIPEIYDLSQQKELTIQQDFQETASECIVSWNALRPSEGHLTFFARVRSGEQWSDWIKIGEWGRGVQRSFSDDHDPLVKLDIDVLAAKSPETRFDAIEVKIAAEEGASLDRLRAISVCAANIEQFNSTAAFELPSILLNEVQGQSQMALAHPRCRDMCSPTSTTVALNYILRQKNQPLEVLDFAARAHDDQFDIYGNWALNAAAAFELTNGEVMCRVERLNDFAHLYAQLQKGMPVVVSIKGPIAGSAMSYSYGHLIAVVGWDAETKEVICMDPAFSNAAETRTRYALDRFLEAWARRQNLSYIFQEPIRKF